MKAIIYHRMPWYGIGLFPLTKVFLTEDFTFNRVSDVHEYLVTLYLKDEQKYINFLIDLLLKANKVMFLMPKVV